MKRCASCGHENDDWRPFCTRCGASYAGAAAEPLLAPPPPDAPPQPAAPGAPDPAGPSESGRHRPSPTVVAMAAVVAVVVAIGAFVGLAVVGSDDDRGAAAPTTTFPAVWDARVTDLVQFVSDERNLDYKHPVKVVFLSKAAFKKRLTTDDSKLSAEDRRELQDATEALRALGMLEGEVDLLEKLNQLSGSSTLAYYDPKKQEIVVPGSKLDVEQRVTLAHELTHALDDQHFDLTKIDKLGDKHDTDAVTALIEGDAQWVEQQYIEKLSAADRRAYQRSRNTGSSPDLEGVPKVFELLQQWPYDFGDQFISILHKEGGQPRINKAFRSPPIDQEQVIDPISFLDGDKPGKISAPALRSGAKKLDSSKEFGALMWYVVLSERIDPHVALEAALGWGADSYIAAREGKRTCIEVHYRGETRRDNAEMSTALRQWIAALPKGMASMKTNADDTLSLHSCDPGSDAKVVTDRSIPAYQLLVFRGQLVEEFVKADATPAISTCVADAVTAQTSVASLLKGKPPPILSDEEGLTRIALTCRATTATAVAPDQIDE